MTLVLIRMLLQFLTFINNIDVPHSSCGDFIRNPDVKSPGWKDMERSGRKQEFGLTDGYGRLGGLRRRVRELLPLRRHTLRTSVNGFALSASGVDRAAVAVAKANAEVWRAQAYQAYVRTQIR